MGKLLKYEMRSMWRKLLPLYVVILILSVLGSFTFGDVMFMIHSNNAAFNVIRGVGTFAYFGLLIAMYVITLMLVLQRFYKGILGDEGYLTHMLPLPTRTLVWGKLWSGTIAFAGTGIVTLLSFAILLTSDFYQLFFFTNWEAAFAQLLEVFPSFPLLLLELAFTGIISIIGSVALLYLCMALGHLSNKHRVLMSFVAYFGISVASNTLSNIVLQVLELFGWLDWMGTQFTIANVQTMQLFTHAVVLGSGLLTLVVFGISMWATIYIVKRKLNLE